MILLIRLVCLRCFCAAWTVLGRGCGPRHQALGHWQRREHHNKHERRRRDAVAGEDSAACEKRCLGKGFHHRGSSRALAP